MTESEVDTEALTETAILTDESPDVTEASEDTSVAPGEEVTSEFSLEDETRELAREFPVLLGEAPESHFNTERYEELRALGVTPREAFLATVRATGKSDDRAHLSGSVPKRARVGSLGMSMNELREARAIFGSMSDEEIRDLYRRVTK